MPKPSKAAVAPEKPAVPARGKATATKGTAASRKAPRPRPTAVKKSAKGAAQAATTRRSTAERGGAPKGRAVTSDRFLDEQRSLLTAEREASLHQAEALRAEADQLAEEMEPGDTQFDEESGEGGTLNIERERDLALSAQARASVEEIDRALARIDAGTYGICDQCGQPIPKARLKALPSATLCVACKSGGLSRR
jgi:DnaK suppressor protein